MFRTLFLEQLKGVHIFFFQIESRTTQIAFAYYGSTVRCTTQYTVKLVKVRLLGTFYDSSLPPPGEKGYHQQTGTETTPLGVRNSFIDIYGLKYASSRNLLFFSNSVPTAVMRARDKYSKTFNNNTFLIFVGSTVLSCANFLPSIKCARCCTAKLLPDRFGTKLQYLTRNYQEL